MPGIVVGPKESFEEGFIGRFKEDSAGIRNPNFGLLGKA